jgi:hypothetical protein
MRDVPTEVFSILINLVFCLQYFGPSFVHDASKNPGSPPPYIDPYELLEDERLTRPSPDVF